MSIVSKFSEIGIGIENDRDLLKQLINQVRLEIFFRGEDVTKYLPFASQEQAFTKLSLFNYLLDSILKMKGNKEFEEIFPDIKDQEFFI